MSSSGSPTRLCSRQTCRRDAVTTLTYVYSDSTAVVGPLAGHAEPHAYDLCAVHADRLTVPRGWRVVRLEPPEARARREDPVQAVVELALGLRPVVLQIIDTGTAVGIDDAEGAVFLSVVIKDMQQGGVLEHIRVIASMKGVTVTEQEKSWCCGLIKECRGESW